MSNPNEPIPTPVDTPRPESQEKEPWEVPALATADVRHDTASTFGSGVDGAGRTSVP